MSLPASNRKAPSRAILAATLSALAVCGTTSIASAQQGFPGTRRFPRTGWLSCTGRL